ncbi:MAG: ComEA family DNA-binding protein [Chloroflexota bacterium]|nr:ComEA family DNA-binding protein [Chloroflexota bacterium]
MDGWVERHRSHIMIVLLNLISLGAAVLLLRRPPSPQGSVLQIATAAPTPTAVPTSTPSPLRVYVSGAVVHPDVYQLPHGSIVKDALAAAGGTFPDADLARINLAQQLLDQQQVHVPRAGETPLPITPAAEAQSSSSNSGCVDINTATSGELEDLPSIGPVYAQRIVEYRTDHGPFSAVEDLTQVKGIGPATLEKIRELVCVR